MRCDTCTAALPTCKCPSKLHIISMATMRSGAGRRRVVIRHMAVQASCNLMCPLLAVLNMQFGRKGAMTLGAVPESAGAETRSAAKDSHANTCRTLVVWQPPVDWAALAQVCDCACMQRQCTGCVGAGVREL